MFGTDIPGIDLSNYFDKTTILGQVLEFLIYTAIAAIVTEAIEKNPKQVEEYRAGNERVLQYMVGQVMKLSKGKANPQLAVAELKKQLG